MDKILYIPRKNDPSEDAQAIKELHTLHPDAVITYLCADDKCENPDNAQSSVLKEQYIRFLKFNPASSKISLVLNLRREKFDLAALGPPSSQLGGRGGRQVFAFLTGAAKIVAYNEFGQQELVGSKRILFTHVPARLGLTKVYCHLLSMGYSVPVMNKYPIIIRIFLYPIFFIFYRVILPILAHVHNILKTGLIIAYFQVIRPAFLYAVLVTSYFGHRSAGNTEKREKPVVGIDAKCIGMNLTGVERSIMNVLNHFPGKESPSKFVFRIYTLNPVPALQANPHMQVMVCGNELKLNWEIGKDLRRGEVDIFHVTWQEMFVYHSLPLLFADRSVYMIHDLINLVLPDYHGKFVRYRYKKLLKKSVTWASVILVPSRATYNAVIKELAAHPEKIHIVPWGITDTFHPLDKQTAKDYVAKKYNIQKDFIMTVGRSYTHKNMVFLFDVFHKLVKETQFTGDLVFIGEKYWYSVNETIEKRVRESKLEDRFYWLEKLSDGDLLHFYNAASVFVFPSRHEGFGFPVLEAMACGAPVVCSTATSLPEVVGDAGLLYSPDDMEGFAEGILRLHSDQELRDVMIRKGLKRSREFDWNQTAQNILNNYETLLKQE